MLTRDALIQYFWNGCQSKVILYSDMQTLRKPSSLLLLQSFLSCCLGVTVDAALQNVNIKEDMFPVSPSQIPDVHFFYK